MEIVHPAPPSQHHNLSTSLSPKAQILHQILTQTPPQNLETALSSSRIQPDSETIQQLLKLLYSSPAIAVKFFRWAGLAQKHSLHSWNLMVDLLGHNHLFEPMWDAIRSMKSESVISVKTFASVFGSYCSAGRYDEAVMSFECMEKYGITPNVIAVNSLLSAICRQENQTVKALEFFERIKGKIPPDADSFAILLEGWEKEGNVAKAKNTFGEMVIRVGWSPQYMPAYDAFLTTLVRGTSVEEAIKFLQVMKGKNCFPGWNFFSNAFDVLVEKNDSVNVIPLWDVMVSSGLVPNLVMYNSVIGLLCNDNDIDNAYRFLDEMVFYGAFPDSVTYNAIFQCLVKNKKVPEMRKFFVEMVKNECPPTHSNCAAAIAMFFDHDDPEAAIEIWEYMVKERVAPLEDSANALLIGICNLRRLSDLRRFLEKMLDRGINVSESTMETVKNAFHREGRGARETYDDLARKWKNLPR